MKWESFRPNFFVIGNASALQSQPASYISAVRVPRGDATTTRALVEPYPNISVIDVDAVIEQVQNTARQATAAVEYVFYFTLAAGLLVLAAAVSASQDERLLEGSVMRVLGASQRQLRLAQASEFLAIGLIASVIAAIAANALTGVIATQVFDLDWQPNGTALFLLGGFGVLVVLAAGLWATRHAIASPPAQMLRSLQG
ncbi:MAG: FtsX-like permease family protein [Lysobacteraceae bacterium]